MGKGIEWGGPNATARAAGLCYLATIAVGAFDHLAIGRWIASPGDPAAVARRLLDAEPLYRLAFALDLLPVYVVVTGLLYGLFKPAGAGLSRIAALASLAGGAVGSAVAVLKIAPLVLLRPDSGLGPGLSQALARTALQLHDEGFAVSLMSFGLYCLLLGVLIVRSRFMPKAVGALMAAGGSAYMAYSFCAFAWPDLATRLSAPTLMLGTLGEAALTFWLLTFGVDDAKWRARAA
jgi:hypothetical protein